MNADWELDNAVCCDPSPDSSVSPPVTAAPADPLEVCNVYININIHNTILLLKVSSIAACLDTERGTPWMPGCKVAVLVPHNHVYPDQVLGATAAGHSSAGVNIPQETAAARV